jgi:hypothetical protein
MEGMARGRRACGIKMPILKIDKKHAGFWGSSPSLKYLPILQSPFFFLANGGHGSRHHGFWALRLVLPNDAAAGQWLES